MCGWVYIWSDGEYDSLVAVVVHTHGRSRGVTFSVCLLVCLFFVRLLGLGWVGLFLSILLVFIFIYFSGFDFDLIISFVFLSLLYS